MLSSTSQGRPEPPPNLCRLKATLDFDPATWTLGDVDEHRKKLGREFSLSKFTLYLLNLEKGCVIVTWLMLHKLAPFLKMLVKGKNLTVFLKLGILKLAVNEEILYPFSTQNPAAERSELINSQGSSGTDLPNTDWPGHFSTFSQAPVTKDDSTRLAIACGDGQLDVTRYLIEEVHCDPKGVVNKSGQTPISLAYANRHKEIVQYLVEVHHCDPRFEVNEAGDTPFHLECTSGDLEMIKCLDDKKGNLDGDVNKSGQTPISLAYANRHKEIVQYLVEVHHCDPRFEVNEAGDTPFHLECTSGDLEMIKCLDDKKGNLDGVVNKSGQTPISLAYANRHKEIVQYLVEVHHCDPRFEVNEAGDTPFHLECTSGDLEMIKCLDDQKGNLDDCLLISCKHNHEHIVDYLLNDRHCDPNVKDNDGQTPLAFTTKIKIIRSLLRHGAQTANVYKTYRNIIGQISSKHAPQNPLTILITGNGGTGKSTFLKAFMKKSSLLKRLGVKRGVPVKGVDGKTVGIIPYLYETKRFGRVLIYDFAGQTEFFASHSAVLQNALHTCPPIIIFCCNLLDREADITKTTAYWMNLIQNQCSALQGQAHILVLGSHADIALERGENPRSKEGIFSPIVAKFGKFKFIAFVPMDCRLPDSAGMKKVRQHVEKSSAIIRSPEAISLSAHSLHIYIQDNFTNELAVPLHVVREKFEVDLKQAQSKSKIDLLSIIPNTLPRVIEMCSQLSTKGHIMFLLNESTPENSYVVCDQHRLLSEITGTVYAPKNFRQHCALSSSTGVVALFKFHIQFRQHDLDMLLAFMSHLEFCFEIKDEQVLKYISTHQQESANSASAHHLDNRYLFFPGLITIPFPDGVWKKLADMKFHFGWILHCSQDVQFFDARCLHVLILRLVFLFKLAPAKAVQHDIPSLQRFCSVWKNGICWCNDDGIICLVELVEHSKALAVQIRCQELTPECLEFRGRVVCKVLETAQQVCPSVATIESVILPAEVEMHPLNTIAQLSLFEIHDMASALHTKNPVKSIHQPASLSSLLRFEPLVYLDRKSLSFLYHPLNPSLEEKVSHSFIAHLDKEVEDSHDKKMFEKIFSKVKHVRSSQRLSHTLETWRSETEGTHQCLRDTLDKYSIFGGRNPLDLAGVPPGDWDPSLLIDTEEPEPVPEHPHQLQPDLVTDIDLDSVDDSTRLGDDDVTDILKELSGMESEFNMLALNLQLSLGHKKDLAGVPPCDWDPSLLAAIEEPEPVPEHTQPDLDMESVDDTTRLDADDDTAEILNEFTNLDSKSFKLSPSLHLPHGKMETIQKNHPHNCEASLSVVIDEWLKLNYNHSKFGKPSWRLLVEAVSLVDYERAEQIASRHPKVCQTILPPLLEPAVTVDQHWAKI